MLTWMFIFGNRCSDEGMGCKLMAVMTILMGGGYSDISNCCDCGVVAVVGTGRWPWLRRWMMRRLWLEKRHGVWDATGGRPATQSGRMFLSGAGILIGQFDLRVNRLQLCGRWGGGVPKEPNKVTNKCKEIYKKNYLNKTKQNKKGS